MKRTLLVFLCVIVPLLALAANHSFFGKLMNGALPGSPNRAYRVNERIQYDWNNDAWQESDKVVHWYPNSTSGKPDSLVTYEWESDTSTWMQSMVMRYTYNAAGRVTALDGYMAFGPGMVFHTFGSSAVYDGQNRLTHFYMNMLNPMTMSLMPFFRLHISYSTQNIASIAGWMSDNGTDDPYWLSTFEFDGNGRVIVETQQASPDSTVGSWGNDTRTLTTYHPNDQSNAATNIEYMANMYPNSFGEAMYLYPGMPQQYTTSTWNGTGWVESEREVFSWDANNRLLNLQDDSMSQTVWTPSYKETFSYNGNGNMSQVTSSEYNQGVWTNASKEIFNWQTYSAVEDINAPSVADLKLSTYPMPFTNVVTINPQSPKAGVIDVNIYNLKGQQVQAFKTLPGQSITWNGTDMQGRACASGIYFAKASQNTAQATVRIIKLK